MTVEPVSLDDITHWAPPGSCERLQVLRLDSIHPVVSGNKWFKLQPNLEAARTGGFERILSFGGGYSNHLVALAFAAREAGIASTGIVRGHYQALTPSLQACRDFGMRLHFIEGSEYRSVSSGDALAIRNAFPDHYIIPEGGASDAGIAGASKIAALLPEDATDVCLAVGTGTTLAGLEMGLPPAMQIHGFCAAKDCGAAHELLNAVSARDRVHWHDVLDPRFGRWKPELLGFMRAFRSCTGIELDVVYTGKMMQALFAALLAGVFTGRRIVTIHTGGLQGNPAGLFHPE